MTKPLTAPCQDKHRPFPQREWPKGKGVNWKRETEASSSLLIRSYPAWIWGHKWGNSTYNRQCRKKIAWVRQWGRKPRNRRAGYHLQQLPWVPMFFVAEQVSVQWGSGGKSLPAQVSAAVRDFLMLFSLPWTLVPWNLEQEVGKCSGNCGEVRGCHPRWRPAAWWNRPWMLRLDTRNEQLFHTVPPISLRSHQLTDN